MATDYAAKAVTKVLKPLLAEHGFIRKSAKKFVRIRGELVDVISLQMSQYGSQLFYLHYFCNLLATPRHDKVLSAYQVGARTDSGSDGVDWKADSIEHASAAILSVSDCCQNDILPWFARINGVRDWLIEYLATARSTVHSLEVAVVLMMLGHTDRPWWILTEIQEQDILKALEAGQQDQLLYKWRRESMVANGIEAAVWERPTLTP